MENVKVLSVDTKWHLLTVCPALAANNKPSGPNKETEGGKY